MGARKCLQLGKKGELGFLWGGFGLLFGSFLFWGCFGGFLGGCAPLLKRLTQFNLWKN